MTNYRTRLNNRFHLIHRVLLRMQDRTESFTVDDVLRVVYVGRKIHPQQRKRARQILFQYVEAGLLRVKQEKRGVRFWWDPTNEPTDEQEIMRERLEDFWPPAEVNDRDAWSLTLIEYYLDGLL